LKPHISLFPVLALLILITIYFELSNLDVLVQDFFYRAKDSTWLVDRDDPIKRLIFYSGAKKVIIFFGLGVLAIFILSYKKSGLIKYRRQLLLIVLSLIFVPAIVAGAKSVTNTYCPWDLELYGSDKPYVKLFEAYPEDFTQERPPKCYPAGHPTGGFAFMVLFFVFKSRKARFTGLAFAISLGWTMGTYQMLKGAHFISHIFTSMLASWLVILMVVAFLNYKKKQFPES
jgi:membrane-associated PAP2 superfamily phosphatase